MKILIIRLSSIGDIILTTPVLKELKRKYPHAIVDFLVLDKFKDAIEGCPYIDNLILFNKKENDGLQNLIEFGLKLRENKYDYIFDLHGKVRSMIISKAIGVKTYRYKKRSLKKTILVKLRLIKYEVDDTIIKNYFKAFKDFDLEYKGEDLTFSFSEDDLKRVMEYKGYPVLAPGASKETKKWTPEGFGKLAALIYQKYKKVPLLIGGKNDYELCEEIRKISGGVSLNLAGKLSLKESGALLSQSMFLVTNDSGPFHIGRGVKCKTFVIFGPTSPGMFEYDENNVLIYGNESCSPCSLHGDKECPEGHFSCMRNITPEIVMEYIEGKR
ncbi:glycosyltransferase family 9 protein [Cetobacterium sp. SF1]|uniref:glycosyltransferase family 9 protein n=1 Tax=unclassified Cetobacterium TaxID=2630983 RepID=UPI003CFA8A10